MSVHSPATANGKMLDRPFVSTHPFHLKRRPDALIIFICVGEITEAGEPVMLRLRQFTGQRISNLPQFLVFDARPGRCLSFRSQHVQMAVFAAKVDPAIAHSYRSGDWFPVRRPERPHLATTRKRHNIQPAIQPAIDDRILQQYRRCDRWISPHVLCGLPGPMTAEAKAFLWTTSIYVLSANTDRAKTYQPRALITRFSTTYIARLNLFVSKAENIDAASIVTASPLPIYLARFVYTKSEHHRDACPEARPPYPYPPAKSPFHLSERQAAFHAVRYSSSSKTDSATLFVRGD